MPVHRTMRCTPCSARRRGSRARGAAGSSRRRHATRTPQHRNARLGNDPAPLLDDAATAKAVSKCGRRAYKPTIRRRIGLVRARPAGRRQGGGRKSRPISKMEEGPGRPRCGSRRVDEAGGPEARRRVGYLAREKDALNRPTVVVVARRHDAMRRDLKASQALCVAVLEDAIAEAVKEGGEQVLALVDLRQVGPQNVDVPFLLWLIMTLRSWPEAARPGGPGGSASLFYSRRCGCRLRFPPIASAESRRWRLSCAKCAHAPSPRRGTHRAWNLIKGAVGRHADMAPSCRRWTSGRRTSREARAAGPKVTCA